MGCVPSCFDRIVAGDPFAQGSLGFLPPNLVGDLGSEEPRFTRRDEKIVKWSMSTEGEGVVSAQRVLEQGLWGMVNEIMLLSVDGKPEAINLVAGEEGRLKGVQEREIGAQFAEGEGFLRGDEITPGEDIMAVPCGCRCRER